MNRKLRWMALVVVTAMLVALVPSLPGAEAAGGVMAYGDTVSGQINNKNYFELWQFDGTKGDRVTITMTGDGQLDPYLGLIEMASEEVLYEDDDSAGNSNAMIEATLPSTGTFAIVATRYDFDQGTSQGQYQLELAGNGGPQQDVNVSNTTEPEMISEGVYYMGPIEMGGQMSGEITNDNYAQVYTLEGQKGDDLVVALFADASNLDPYLIVANSNGDVLAEDDDSGAQVGGGKADAYAELTLPGNDTYLIIATRAGVDSGKSNGAYVLVAGAPEQANTPSEPTNQQSQDMPEGMAYIGDVSFGVPATGTISDAEYVHFYTFAGQAGDTVTITARGDGSLDTYLGLMDPNDEIVAEDDDSGGGQGGMDAQISTRLTESGTYIIIVTRSGIDSGSTSGDYTLELVEGPPPAPDNTETQGAGGWGGLPGRAFPTDEGTFYLRGMGRSTNPDKQTPLEQYLNKNQEETLPGRSFQLGTDSFYLRGTGRTTDVAKMAPLAAFLESHKVKVQ